MDTTSSSFDISTLSDGPKNYCIMNSSTPRNQEVKVEDEKPRIKQDYHSRRKTGNQDKRSTVQFYKLFSFADSTDVILMIVGAAGAMANGASLPLMTILFGNMIDSFGGNSDTHDMLHKVAKISLEYVYLAVVTGVASFLQVACWMATGERQASRIRNIYLKAILRQEISFFDKETNTGEVVERMSGDTVLIQDAMGEKVGKFIQLISTFLGSFVAAFSQGWLLTLVMLSTIPPTVIAGTAMSTLITKRASRGQVAYAEAAIIVEQTIGSIRTVASFTGEKQSVNKFSKSLRSAYNSSVQEGLAAGLGIGTVTLLMFCGYSLGVWYGSYLILHKHYTGAKVINVIFAILVGSLSISQAPPCMTAFAAGQASAFKMFETINRKPEIDAYDMTGKVLDDIRGDVEFRDIYFSYPSRPEERIFSGFSMYIQNGMTMAMVGESGSGKSTVISLIERFYDPQAGEVLIDGINLKEFQLRWIRGKIGLVSQEPVLFASSIRDNITYGKDDVTTEEINAALQLSNASNFIYKMPQGIDTMVGEHGIQLSGGQKQRIAIARTILKVPRILLLDEATSALDAESEGILQDALDKVMENRTTIVVAHRLSTVRNADMITVLHQGLIVQKGSLPELMKDPNGAYCQLTRLQELNQDQPSSIILDVGSSAGNSSRHSFMNLPTEVDVEGNILEESGSMISSLNLNEVSLRRLAKLNKKEIPELILGVIATIVIGLLFPIFGLLLSSVITTFYKPAEKLQKESKFWSLTFLIFALVSLLATPARSYFFAVAGSKLVRRIRLMTFDKVVNMEIGWFDDPANSSGAIGARLSADAAAIRSLVGDALALVVQNIATLAAGLVIAFVANWQLSLIVLALVPLLVLNGWIQMKFMKGFSGDAKIMYDDASRVATDAVGSIRTIVSFSAEERVMELYKKKCEDPMKAGIRQGLIGGTGFGLSFFLLFCCYAASFYAGARLIQDGKTSFVKVFQVFFSLALTAIGISQSSSLAPDYSKAKPAIASVFAILDQKSKINPSEDFGMTLEEVKGNIEFQHVSFRYPSRPDARIFQDLCLFIKSGKTVALVGESGSGKSTAISLLQRFYNPDSGHILIDGIEIRKFQLRWLRQKMGLVSQEPVLFNDTIRANISYGKEEQATEAEIVSAAQSANAHKFICSLQQGYNTLVGERGIQLSGGQKQRVAIARAIVKEPRILLLDEATSALDAESERVVQDALDRVMMNRTTVVVAHRLGTIRGADLIAVIKNGMIVEKGKHEKLINIKDGVYASLVAIQSRSSS